MQSIVQITAMHQLICSFMDQDHEISFNLVAKKRVCKLKLRPINSCDYTWWSHLKDMSDFVFLPSFPEQIRIAFSEHSTGHLRDASKCFEGIDSHQSSKHLVFSCILNILKTYVYAQLHIQVCAFSCCATFSYQLPDTPSLDRKACDWDRQISFRQCSFNLQPQTHKCAASCNVKKVLLKTPTTCWYEKNKQTKKTLVL